VLLFSRHSTLLQTAYSELKRRAAEQSRLFVGTPGSVDERVVRGRRFYYRQFYDAEGNKRAEYIGPREDMEADERARATREKIDLANALIREARDLAQHGYARVDPRAGAILAALANGGLFRAGAILVGSHAYGAILGELGVRAAAYLTEDVDIARGAPLGVLVRPDATFGEMLAESTIRLHPVPSLDRKAHPTSFKAHGGDRLRVDLLVPTSGSEVTTRAVPELGAYATALPFFAYLLADPIESVVLGRAGVVPVRLPRPERFAWHKMLVSQLRSATREKRGKDLVQAAVLFAVLAEDAPDALAEAFAQLPRGSKEKTRIAARQVHAQLDAGGHARAMETLERFL
jgi:hypothetical protein